jgi:predicted PurR-regulated permease PerM
LFSTTEWHDLGASVKPARRTELDPSDFWRLSVAGRSGQTGIGMSERNDQRLLARSDLAWAVAVGGIGTVLFTAALWFAWHYAATLFLIFAGVLLGVALTALSELLGRFIRLPEPIRLAIVCLMLAVMLSGVLVLGGATIAQQATVLSNTIKSQLTNVKSFLERNGVDTSYFDLGNLDSSQDSSGAAAQGAGSGSGTGAGTSHNLPSASTIASSGGAIVSQSLKVLLGTVSVVGNFFIVVFLGLAFAAQPAIYRAGLIFMAPAKYHTQTLAIVDQIGETLKRWLLAQLLTMFAVFAVTWIGLALIGIPSSFILGIQAGLLAFIPTVGALIGGLIVVLASLASGWVAALSAAILFLGVHALESYVLTPIIQRQALDIPPATLFSFQILLGVVFGIWGLALALPLMAIGKVMIDYFKGDDTQAA